MVILNSDLLLTDLLRDPPFPVLLQPELQRVKSVILLNHDPTRLKSLTAHKDQGQTEVELPRNTLDHSITQVDA